MEVEHEHARQRRPRVSLTRRQREVLTRIVEGKTNGEIAEELGISLDGVKYHVREIFALLGVDTCEEAAEWWRQQHGMRARMSVARDRLERMPAMIRWGLAGGAALAVAAVALVVFWPRDEDGGGLDPGVWVALPVPIATDERAEWLVQLRLVNARTGEERNVGEPGAWYFPSLSSDGTRLYALEFKDYDQGSVVLHLFDLGGGEPVEIPWQRTYAPETAVWSPDGSRLSVTTHDWAGVMTPDGVLHGGAFRPEPEVGSGTGRCSWTADSSRFMCVAGNYAERMVIVDRDGGLIAFLEDDALAPSPLDTLRRLGTSTYIRWMDAEEIEIIATTIEDSTRETRSWRSVGDLDAAEGTLTWGLTEELSEPEATALFEEQIARQREVFEGHGIPDGSPQGAIRDSLDGEFAGAFISPSQPSGEPAPAGSEVTFVAFAYGKRFAYPLGYLERPARSTCSSAGTWCACGDLRRLPGAKGVSTVAAWNWYRSGRWCASSRNGSRSAKPSRTCGRPARCRTTAGPPRDTSTSR